LVCFEVKTTSRVPVKRKETNKADFGKGEEGKSDLNSEKGDTFAPKENTQKNAITGVAGAGVKKKSNLFQRKRGERNNQSTTRKVPEPRTRNFWGN